MKTSPIRRIGLATVVIFACALPTAAQTTKPALPAGCDIHVFMLDRPEGELVAKLRAVGSRRLAVPEPDTKSIALFVTPTGSTTIVLSRTSDGALHLGNETLRMSRGRLRGSQSEDTTWRPDRPLFLMGPVWGSSAPSHVGAHAAIVWVVPADAATGEPTRQDTGTFVAALIDAATSPLDPQFDVATPSEDDPPAGNRRHDAPRQRARAGRMSFGGPVAASVPLAHIAVAAWVPPESVDRLLAVGRAELAATRATGATGALPALLAPMVALGELDAMDVVISAREGDESGLGGSREQLDAAMFVAFAGATDPTVRGTAGWACFQRDPRAVTLALQADIQSGRAIIPGDAATAAGRVSQVAATAAFMDVRTPALITVGGMLAFTALVLVMRRLLDRWLFR